jgi:hypothetical protein
MTMDVGSVERAGSTASFTEEGDFAGRFCRVLSILQSLPPSRWSETYAKKIRNTDNKPLKRGGHSLASSDDDPAADIPCHCFGKRSESAAFPVTRSSTQTLVLRRRWRPLRGRVARYSTPPLLPTQPSLGAQPENRILARERPSGPVPARNRWW